MGHKCKKKELNVLLSYDDEEEIKYGELENMTHIATPDTHLPETSINPEISLNSVMGFSNPKTLKLSGTIFGEAWW